MSLIIHSATKLDADGITPDFWLFAENDSITETGTGTGWQAVVAPDATTIDARDRWLTPGFVDLHGHGGGGHAYDDGRDEILAAVATHRAHGTTRSVISLVANPLSQLRESLSEVADLVDEDPLIVGSHLEGPYLARNHRGAHNPQFLRAPQLDDVRELIDAARGTLRQVTIAPELPGALEAIDLFVEAGVVVAVGHTDADLELTKQAFDRGATLLTHAFNAMPGIKHREPGPVVAAFDDPRIAIELIVDGFHVHPDVARMAFLAAPQRIILITDAMAAAGSVDGNYRLGSLNVTVSGGRAMLSGTSTIAGSTLTQDAALRSAIEGASIDPILAIRSLTASPARAIGLDERVGRLRAGFTADAVVLDADWSVDAVFVGGRAVS